MKIVKGSSFATWTKKLQGKGGGFSRTRSAVSTSSRKSSRKDKNGIRSPLRRRFPLSPSSAASEEQRGDNERSARFATNDPRDRRDDVAAVDHREDPPGGSIGSIASKESTSELGSQILSQRECDPLSEESGGAAAAVAKETGSVDVNESRQEDRGDQGFPTTDREPIEETMNILPDKREFSPEQVDIKSSETPIEESQSQSPPDPPSEAISPVVSSVVSESVTSPGTVFSDKTDDVLIARYADSETSSSGVESVSSNTKDSSSSEETQSLVDVTSAGTERENQDTGDTHRKNAASEMRPEPSSGGGQIEGQKHGDYLDQTMPEPARLDHENHEQTQPNQESMAKGRTLAAEIKVVAPGGANGEDDGESAATSSGSQANTAQGSLGSRSVPEDQYVKVVVSATSPTTTTEEVRARPYEYEETKNKQPSNIQTQRLPSSVSTNTESEGPESEIKDNEDTFNEATMALASDEEEIRDSGAKASGRRFPKAPKLASWAKRLTKSDKNLGDQEAIKASLAQEQAKTREEVLKGASFNKMTMKNRMRQEKRALGRVRQNQKRFKNSLVGVGEIISTVGTPTSKSPLFPLSSDSNLSVRSPVPQPTLSLRSPVPQPTLSLQSPASQSPSVRTPVPLSPKFKEPDMHRKVSSPTTPDEKMADMIWWSNDKQCVEIIAVKSDEFAQAWDKEQESKGREKQSTKNDETQQASGFVTDDDDSLFEKESTDEMYENQFSHSETERHKASKMRVKKSRSKKGKVKVKRSKNSDKRRYERSPSPSRVQRRERLRSKKTRRKAHHNTRRALASMSSEDFSENEHCACNEEVMEDSRILCGDGEAEEAGLRDIRYDLREMAKELLRQGPAVMVRWLE